VRGLSTLLILDYLMRRVNEGRPIAQQRKPHEIFDMIGGTSTGGYALNVLIRVESLVLRPIQIDRYNDRPLEDGCERMH
jgi:hypothetical protein